MDTLWQEITENVIFVIEFLVLVALLFAVSYAVQKWENKRNNVSRRILNTRMVAVVGMFSALAAILMIFEFPLPFAPSFYKLDFSEIPILVAAFAFGPVAGVMTEFCKILLNLLMDSTTTAFVGELANFMVGCSFVLPASIVYQFKKSRGHALLGCVTGTVLLTVFGTLFNAVYLLPKFAQLYGMPLEALVEMGTAINPAIDSVGTFVFFAVAPLNLLKGSVASIVTLLIYKKLSPILKAGRE